MMGHLEVLRVYPLATPASRGRLDRGGMIPPPTTGTSARFRQLAQHGWNQLGVGARQDRQATTCTPSSNAVRAMRAGVSRCPRRPRPCRVRARTAICSGRWNGRRGPACRKNLRRRPSLRHAPSTGRGVRSDGRPRAPRRPRPPPGGPGIAEDVPEPPAHSPVFHTACAAARCGHQFVSGSRLPFPVFQSRSTQRGREPSASRRRLGGRAPTSDSPARSLRPRRPQREGSASA